MIRCVLVAALLAAAALAQKIAVRGTYSDPKPFWARNLHLDDLSVNAIFTGAGSITPELMSRAAAEGARVYAEFPTLNGKGYVEKHPEAWPVNERGERAEAATWFLGACPTEPGFRAYRMQQLETLLERYDVAGVWMDYFHWHAQFEEPEPILPETCFSDSCLTAFSKATGVRLPAGTTSERAHFILANHDRAWRDWRVSVLDGWATDIKARLRARRPGALLGVYHAPFTDTEFHNARRRTLGLDLVRLSSTVDVFSPMVYHRRMGRSPEWVGEYVSWLSGALPARARIWPIVQALDATAPEFEQVMKTGASGRASGLMMFTAGSVAKDPDKLHVLRRLYREWARP